MKSARKRILSLLLGITILLALLPTSAFAASFSDVSQNAYYNDAVNWAVENDITSGTGGTYFSPAESCSRAQTVTFLWRAAGQPKASGTSPFVDVAANAYCFSAVRWAVAEGITAGTSASTFAPDQPCTRAEIATFLYRASDDYVAPDSDTDTTVVVPENCRS